MRYLKSMVDENILDKTLALLKKYYLCDNCLGRLFARLGRGLTNKQRGETLKIVALMEAHRKLIEGLLSVEEFEKIATNIGSIADDTVAELGLDLKLSEIRKCSICGFQSLDLKINEYAKKALELLRRYSARTFLVGVMKNSSIERKEEAIASEYGLKFYENVRNELKREVGKAVQSMSNMNVRVDFSKPDIVVVIDLDKDIVSIRRMPLYLKGLYWKLGRNISQSKWILWDGSKKYPYSVQEALETLKELIGAKEVVLHASGREDVDVRMLGSGRLFIVEVKEPEKYSFSIRDIERKVNEKSRYVKVRFLGEASRKEVRLAKMEHARKIKVYKALVVVDKNVSEEQLRGLEEYFTNKVVRQRTPRRVLHRRPDVVRLRRVHSIKTKLLSSHVFEALIKCDGGLYIKELVSGDNGRTKPSFSEYLKAEAKCVELDVVYVST